MNESGHPERVPEGRFQKAGRRGVEELGCGRAVWQCPVRRPPGSSGLWAAGNQAEDEEASLCVSLSLPG